MFGRLEGVLDRIKLWLKCYEGEEMSRQRKRSLEEGHPAYLGICIAQ